MGISRKSRCKIVVNGREYLWYVAPDVDAGDVPTLSVVSADRSFFVTYTLWQPESERHVVVIGKDFRGATCGGPYRRFLSPAFGTLDTVSPKDVRALIEWALLPGPPRQEVDWRGLPLTLDDPGDRTV